MYPSILAIQPYVLYVQQTLIIKHTSCGCTTKPFGLQQLLGSFSVCEKLDAVHKVYDGGGGLKFTCTLQY